jgi:hypothetical protein
MPRKIQHHPWDKKTFEQGANSSVDPEMMDKGKTSGEYLDAENMRNNSQQQKYGTLKKIDGEKIVTNNEDTTCTSARPGNIKYYSNQSPAKGTFVNGKWECMAAIDVAVGGIKRKVELWADSRYSATNSNYHDPFIRVDDKIVAASIQLPIRSDRPILIKKSDKGEIFFTDRNNPTVILNVEDMLLNSNVSVGDKTATCTLKYFENFNISSFITNLNTPTNYPVFIELTNSLSYPADKIFSTTGVSGLIVGQYTYSLRYGNTSGDRSNRSFNTPLIPVVISNSSESLQYPRIKTFGDEAGDESGFGIVLKFRVYNNLNYDFVEVIRTDYIDGKPLGFVPESSVLIGFVDLVPGEISIKTIVDFGGNQETLDFSQEIQTLTSIKNAKTIDYNYNRLWQYNVEYESREIDTNGLFLEWDDDSKIVPIVHNMGEGGHGDTYNSTYFKSNMGGERQEFGIVCVDENFTKSFVIPISVNETLYPDGFQFPDRRDIIGDNSLSDQFSYLGTPLAGRVDGSYGKCFEKYSLANAISKTDETTKYTIDNIIGNPYKPLTPTSPSDPDVEGHNYKVQKNFYVDNNTTAPVQQKMFGGDKYSLGLALRGLDVSKLPSWVKAISLVKTKPANRIVAQGIGFYDFNIVHDGLSSKINGKKKNSLIFFSPDMASFNGLATDSLIEDIDSSGLYEIQLVAPVGFSTELYGGKISLLSGGTSEYVGEDLDMCVYTKLTREDGNINVGQLQYDNGTGKNHVKFGRYRNTDALSWSQEGGVDGNISTNRGVFSIKSFRKALYLRESDIVGNRGGEYFRITLFEDIYKYDLVSVTNARTNPYEYNNTDTKNMHEPMYIVNIIKKNSIVSTGNVVDYYDTGTFIKLESIIGVAKNVPNESFDIVDERWEDCINSISGTGGVDQDGFVWIRDDAGNDRAFMDVTGADKNWLNTVRADIQNNGYYVLGTSLGNVNVYGLYTHVNTNNRFFSIVFNVEDANGNIFLAEEGEELIVKYNPARPIRFFGGDTYIGDSIFAPIDDGGDNADVGVFVPNHHWRMVGFPFLTWRFNDLYRTLFDSDKVNPKLNPEQKFKMSAVRQMVCVFNNESRVQNSFAHELPTPSPATYQLQRFFPSTHYIPRPGEFSTTNSYNDNFVADGGAIYDDYRNTYPEETLLWHYGGFRFLPQTLVDYIHLQNIRVYDSKPVVGFEEQTKYTPINVQDVPNLKSFLSGNFYDADDQTGGIMYSWHSDDPKFGNSVFFATERGICMLLVGKNITTNAVGGNLQVTLK